MKRYALGLCILVACFAGSYVFIYLYRWEWNRALMSAALFLVAEVALIGAVVMDRLRQIEAKLDRGVEDEAAPAVPALPRLAPHGQAFDFPWLRPPGEPADRFGVFIPVLMGAGVVLSGVAWLVERIARLASRGGSGRGRPDARGLPALPPGGPFADHSDATGTGPPSVVSGPRRRVAVAVGALAVVAPGVFLIADLTQSRPDAPAVATASAVTLDARSNQPWSGRMTQKVEARWVFCAEESNPPLRVSTLHRVDGERFVGVVTPAMGEHAVQRFIGCLQDAAVDFVLLDVLAVDEVGRVL